MDMREKWSKLLKQCYNAKDSPDFISEITPELIQELKPFLGTNSLFGISITTVDNLSRKLLNQLLENYRQTNQTLTFQQFCKQELFSAGMPETFRFLNIFYK